MSNKPIGRNPANRRDTSAKNTTGWVAEQVDLRDLNEEIFRSHTDWIWGTENQVKVTNNADFYTDGSGNPLDLNDAAVTINEDDKILIAHDVTQTTNLLLDCGGKKITLEMLAGVTLDMDTFDVTLGGTGDSIGGDIRLTQAGDLAIVGNRGLSVNNSVSAYEEFKANNLIINVQSNTTVDADADNIIFVDEFGGGKRVDNIDDTFDMATDRNEGTGTTNELLSTWYWMWRDGAGVKKLAPDLTGTADANVLNSLSDSAASFQTFLVQPGDEIFQTTDNTKGFVKSVSAEGLLTCKDKDGADLDLFPLGTETYKIRMLSPPGLGQLKARIGAAYNNSSGNLDDSIYTQSQDIKTYYEAKGDIGITGADSFNSNDSGVVLFYQIDDSWYMDIVDLTATTSNTSLLDFTFSGIDMLVDQTFLGFTITGATSFRLGVSITSTRVNVYSEGALSDWTISATRVKLNKKPSAAL